MIEEDVPKCAYCKHYIGYLCRGRDSGLCNKYINPEIEKSSKIPDIVTGIKPADDDWFHPGYSCREARENEELCGKQGKGWEPKEQTYFEFYTLAIIFAILFIFLFVLN